MKKNLVALFATLALGGAVFAENYTKGIDLQFGIPIAATKMTMEIGPVEYEQNIFEVGGQFKLATYDCFLLNDMLGIYAAIGVNPGLFLSSNTISASFNDEEIGFDSHLANDAGFGISCEFMIGPAFGVNLGGVRFQTGLAFHAVFAWGIGYYDYDNMHSSGEMMYKVHYNSFGLALTPQFRFGASNRCSFILGCDLTFDFPNELTFKIEGEKFKYEFDKGFRFGATPYIGLGINF